MTPYAEHEVFGVGSLGLYEKARALVQKIPEKLDGEWVRCHELVRAVAEVLALDKSQVADGWYGHVEHSWLWTRPKLIWETPPILDVYVVGRLPSVQLVDSSPTFPWEYRRGDLRSDIQWGVVAELVRRMRLEPKPSKRKRRS